MSSTNSKFFKVYVYISLFLIVILLASLVGAIAYAGVRLKNESSVVTNKVNTFNESMNTVNKNLENINSQLTKENEKTITIPTGL